MIEAPAKIKELRSRLSKFRDNVTASNSRFQYIKSQRESAEEIIQKLNYSADLNQRSSEVFKAWLEEELDSSINSMADLVTTALKFVIDDQNLIFKIVQELKYNRLSMRFSIEDDGIEGDPRSSFGGGIAVLASVILRISVMARTGMANLLILDESMKDLANKYIPSAADFFRRLSEETGINILMVTHNEEFMTNAHVAYDGFSVRDSENSVKAFRIKRRA